MTTSGMLEAQGIQHRPSSVRLTSFVGPKGVSRVRRVAPLFLAAQLIALIVWSVVRADRFALTFDFSVYYQAWWLIAHGHLSAYDSALRFPFWQNHGEFLMWPLAVLGVIWSSPIMLLGIQCVALVATEWVCFAWLCDVVEASCARHSSPEQERLGVLIAGVGLVLLVACPWIYWTDSFDFHFEVIGVLFVALAGRDLYSDPQCRRLWLWIGLALLSGDVLATYVVALGLSAVLAGRRWRKSGCLIVLAGILWAIILTAIGANRGSNLVHNYGYLALAVGVAEPAQLGLLKIVKGIALHPGHLLSVLWGRRLDIYAILAPAGIIGVVSPWAAVGAALVLIESGLNRNSGFIAPSFQDLLLFVLVPIGTAHVLMALGHRHRRWAAGLAVALAINTIGWGIVWIPQIGPRWLRVSPAAASALSSVSQKIPASDEVVVSQGVAGLFAGRQWVYDYSGPARIPIRTGTVWFVVTPAQGIELASVRDADALIEQLAGPLHAQMIVARADVWAFRWKPPPGIRDLSLPPAYPTIASWTATGTAGTVSRVGPEADWRAVANGRTGYVVSGDYWTEPPGTYEVTAILSTTVPVNVEVWNTTGDILLFRRSVPPTNGQVAIGGLVDDRHVYAPTPVYDGAGPFRILPTSPTPDNALEIRIWSPGGGLVSVASLELQPVGTSASG